MNENTINQNVGDENVGYEMLAMKIFLTMWNAFKEML